MKPIVITGPESSGKTTLARHLITEFDLPYIPEYARVYLESISRDYTPADIINIAIGQVALVESISAAFPDRPYLILDTWMLEIRIWVQYRFGEIPDVIEKLYREHLPVLYVLCTPDIAWAHDPLRENPHDREELFGLYQTAIEESLVPYIVISGERRENQAVQGIHDFLRR